MKYRILFKKCRLAQIVRITFGPRILQFLAGEIKRYEEEEKMQLSWSFSTFSAQKPEKYACEVCGQQFTTKLGQALPKGKGCCELSPGTLSKPTTKWQWTCMSLLCWRTLSMMTFYRRCDYFLWAIQLEALFKVKKSEIRLFRLRSLMRLRTAMASTSRCKDYLLPFSHLRLKIYIKVFSTLFGLQLFEALDIKNIELTSGCDVWHLGKVWLSIDQRDYR